MDHAQDQVLLIFDPVKDDVLVEMDLPCAFNAFAADEQRGKTAHVVDKTPWLCCQVRPVSDGECNAPLSDPVGGH
nr:MAG TPA: hypothetical protein [Caudoviricetes sp.]